MPNATAVPGVGGPQATTPTAQQRALSFDQASHHGVELSSTFTGVQLGGGATGTSSVTVGTGPISILPQGYLRGVLIDLVTTTAGSGGTPAGNGDYPFSLLNLLRLHDTNGATMHEHSGYLNYLLNLFSGMEETSDPTQWPDYSSSATSPSVQWYLPVELDSDGFGSLANQSAADTYKLDLVLETPGNSYTTAPSSANPIFTINVYADYWTLPGAQDMLGRPQQQEPPYHGVAQYTYQSTGNSTNSGAMTLKIGFTGNMYRMLLLVGRAAGSGYATGGARSGSVLPDPYTLRYDTRDLMIGSKRENRRNFYGLLNTPNTTFLTGVYAFLWNYGNIGRRAGGKGFSSWLPTLPATRFELTGTWGAGTVDYLANTVSVAETNPALRGVSPSATGYSPPVAATVPGAQ